MHRPGILLHEVGEAIELLVRRFQNDFGLTPVVAAEIEFYLKGSSRLSFPESMAADLHRALMDEGIETFPMEKERGHEQFEIATLPLPDPAQLGRNLLRIREVVESVASVQGCVADFSAKPFEDEPGSGLHVHLHLEDSAGINQFTRKGQEGDYSIALQETVAGMLRLMAPSMPIFAPSEESYKRFVMQTAGAPVHPVTVSWGPNNRTVAIRLPSKPVDNKHIEHRVAGSDADPMMVIAAVLAGAHYGIRDKLRPDEPVHGNAHLSGYARRKLPNSLDDAYSAFRQSDVLFEYFEENLLAAYLRQLMYPAAF